MALRSHAALAGIRDSLLKTCAINDARNQPLLSLLEPRVACTSDGAKKRVRMFL
jgi:hypothetical protein